MFAACSATCALWCACVTAAPARNEACVALSSGGLWVPRGEGEDEESCRLPLPALIVTSGGLEPVGL